MRKFLKSQLHGATITHADLKYEGSITLPPDLMLASGIEEYEAVWVWDVTNGARLETYAIRGKENTRDISMNGAAAHLVHAGDKVIIACFNFLTDSEVKNYKPKLIFIDENNNIKDIRAEVPGPQLNFV